MTEFNRRGGRHKTDDTGRLKLGMFSSAACSVADLSTSGARLVIDRECKLPKRFMLTLDGSRFKRMCTARWQKGTEIGVEFLYD